ncbi:MAG: hypothetical protein ACE5I1_03050 [bacterium]
MREFNISGRIIPEEHYCVNLSQQIHELVRLVEKRTYFVINRPRQFGKTTLLSFLAKHLLASGRFLPVLVSFEGYGENPDLDLEIFYQAFWENVLQYLETV